ncbi:unnamed protein product [Prunus armeniaca]|uniref:Uncharacterized protein n=1 Tax=Prunus armeniaca TaxID=36596 RepID=A0A6J5UIE5_PRUAR|nr:unnamed protein product [Prunus armeniaca]
MKDSESPDSRGKKPRRILFNLELPADEYISDGEEPGGDFMGSERSSGLTDLNEPIQIDRVSASTSVFKFGNDFSSKEDIERQVLSANAYKGVWPFAKESQKTHKWGRMEELVICI